MNRSDIPYYDSYLPGVLRKELLKNTRAIPGIPGLQLQGTPGTLETPEALKFLADLYERVKKHLNTVLEKRNEDRAFIDARMKACAEANRDMGIPFTSVDYITPIGLKDHNGRVVFGPLSREFYNPGGEQAADYPTGISEFHITLFGPPDSRKMAVNAMNCFHRRLAGEPPIIGEILTKSTVSPEWGADLEDSKTPIHRDMAEAAENLGACLRKELEYTDEKTGKSYTIANDRTSLPYKRFPGLALPCGFLFYNSMPIPVHLYDFALHLFHNWDTPGGLLFYVPKLENEEEAAYLKDMIETAETMLQKIHPGYKTGSVRLMIVLENPRAIFRINEIMDALYPYFLGASLGWHDYLASSARLFKEDPNYRIPVKADPKIVIKHIKSSHEIVARVVGARGGISVGGMYGVLPLSNETNHPSFQVSIKGFFKDVITQLKRGLQGFWVAHPDFVRIGIAVTEAWKTYSSGDPQPLFALIDSLLNTENAREVRRFVDGEDIPGLSVNDPGYPRDLVVARLSESDYIKNNDPREIGFNVFQTLQYLADWLRGNGCVALPATIEGVQVRIMDDLATTERSRWEVWHEVCHGRISLEEFLDIALTEYEAIKRGENRKDRQIQVKWDSLTGQWYPVAFILMCKLMTAPAPPEFASELLLPFTLEGFRDGENSFNKLKAMMPDTYTLLPRIERYLYYYAQCSSRKFAAEASKLPVYDDTAVRKLITSFSKEEIIEAAGHHGNIGDPGKKLNGPAAAEQKGVLSGREEIRRILRKTGEAYLERFGFKYLVSAQGKTGEQLLADLEKRMKNSPEEEMNNAREALYEITAKRIASAPPDTILHAISKGLKKYAVPGISAAVRADGELRTLCLGLTETEGGSEIPMPVTPETCFDIASLSKTVAAAFSLEVFSKAGISIDTPVETVLRAFSSPFRLDPGGKKEWKENLSLRDCMSHRGLNMHYVNAVPYENHPASVTSILLHPEEYGYEEVKVIREPGTGFGYSGGGFMVLEHLIELILGDRREEVQNAFLKNLGLDRFFFDRSSITGSRALGCFENGETVSKVPHWFPSFAAGCVSTPENVLRFLGHLECAFRSLEGSGGISHNTAVEMLYGTDNGAVEFMGLKMGLGIFTGEAGPNRIAVHQGANEGYRAVYLYCYDGPDRGTGFAICANGDNNAVPVIAETMQNLLILLGVQGIDHTKFTRSFKSEGIAQEEIVNRGYRELVFNAFEPDLPERHPRPASETEESADPLLEKSILKSARLIEISNQSFGRGENLISVMPPVFDPGVFGSQGKVVDSWETARHNYREYDYSVFTLDAPATVKAAYLSTAFHDGNHPRFVSIEGRGAGDSEWISILEKTAAQGHSECALILNETRAFKEFRFSMYPDGGLTRAGLFTSIPEESRIEFKAAPEWVPIKEKIPLVTSLPVMPLSCLPPDVFKKNSENADFASALTGAYIDEASNEHYSPASALISPFPPLHMFDGLETARSRAPGHHEEVVISLGKPVVIKSVILDFTWFRNNNPRSIELYGFDSRNWIALSPPVKTKAFAGNKKEVSIDSMALIHKIKIICRPDGGLNRIHVFEKESHEQQHTS